MVGKGFSPQFHLILFLQQKLFIRVILESLFLKIFFRSHPRSYFEFVRQRNWIFIEIKVGSRWSKHTNFRRRRWRHGFPFEFKVEVMRLGFVTASEEIHLIIVIILCLIINKLMSEHQE